MSILNKIIQFIKRLFRGNSPPEQKEYTSINNKEKGKDIKIIDCKIKNIKINE